MGSSITISNGGNLEVGEVLSVAANGYITQKWTEYRPDGSSEKKGDWLKIETMIMKMKNIFK